MSDKWTLGMRDRPALMNQDLNDTRRLRLACTHCELEVTDQFIAVHGGQYYHVACAETLIRLEKIGKNP